VAKTKIKELIEKSSRTCFEVKEKNYAFQKGVKQFLFGGDDATPEPIMVEDALKRSDVLNYLVENKSTLIEEITEDSFQDSPDLEETERRLAAKDAEIKALKEQLATVK
jgi:Txe/YoeB family toxin of Txe-Axe toxin-antitoxin module